MTDKPQDPCRVMAEVLWPIINCGPAPYSYAGENERHLTYIKLIEEAIRDHTVFPEMVSMLKRASCTLFNADSINHQKDLLYVSKAIEELLVKAEGR